MMEFGPEKITAVPGDKSHFARRLIRPIIFIIRTTARIILAKILLGVTGSNGR